ncbi:hypothetical protein VNO78_12352 [Psophocarpus tetragonolobus]|uniref:Uncharacterized protein n=1 Tax=Psophocarpus tetragonolobus TaxID=3891 RepID=A0AAN9SQL9_PSOTE
MTRTSIVRFANLCQYSPTTTQPPPQQCKFVCHNLLRIVVLAPSKPCCNHRRTSSACRVAIVCSDHHEADLVNCINCRYSNHRSNLHYCHSTQHRHAAILQHVMTLL